MDEINDQFILNYFYATPNSTKINGHKSQNIPDNIQQYLNNRFDDSESNKETIMRIKYGVEKRPLCPICNKPVRWYGHKADRLFFNTCCHEHEVILRKKNVKNAVNEKYGVDNVFQLNNVKENIKQTCIKRYGVDNPQKSKIIKEKTENTCLQKYGHKNFGGGKEAKKKIQESLIKHFGSREELSAHVKQLSQQTRLEKYGDPHYNNMEKNKKTCLEHYHVPYYFQSDDRYKRHDEFMQKVNKTKRKNNTWVQSKAESCVYNILRRFFEKGDVLCQYRSDIYPFNCDFYIKSLDLYIEYQGMWTHGLHPYNPNNIDDVNLVNKWKSYNKDFYNNAIYTWTISDPNKRNIAKVNNINFLEFWDIKEVQKYFEKYEENRG